MLTKSDSTSYFLSGLATILFGIIALTFKSEGFKDIATIFCVFVIVNGIITTISAFRDESSHWRKIGGVVSIIVGVFAFISLSNPVLLQAGWSTVLGVWAIATGVTELLYAFKLPKVIEKEWIFLVTGIISVGFGSIILAEPIRASFLPLNLIVGIYSVVWGVALTVLAIRVWKLPSHETEN